MACRTLARSSNIDMHNNGGSVNVQYYVIGGSRIVAAGLETRLRNPAQTATSNEGD